MYKKILVPLDGSTLSELALANAVTVAEGCQVAELILIIVIEPFKSLAHWVSDDIAMKMEKEASAAAQKYIDQTVERLSNEGVDVEAVIARGNPGEAVLEYAVKNNIDLIVMGTHGRSGFSRLMFGSVASHIIHHSPIPVLLVPPTSLTSNK
jgi:nucleotide-binding universal stress UspA family protein